MKFAVRPCGPVGAMVLTGAILWCLAAARAAPPEIDFLYPEAPGVIYTNADGHADGPLYQAMAAIFEKAQIPFRATEYPFARLLDALKTEPNAFSVVDYPPVLEECCIFTKDPTFIGDVAAYHTADLPPVRKKEDLDGHLVVTMRGHTYGALTYFFNDAKNHIAQDTAADHSSGFNMLRLRRADYFVTYSINAAAFLAEHPIPDVRCETFDRTRLYFALSKSYPNAAQVMAQLEAIFKGTQTDLKSKTYDISCQ